MARAEHLHARGRQLDRERNAVQPTANIYDDRRALVGEFKLLVGAERSFDEERNRRRPHRFAGNQVTRRILRRHLEGRHPVRLLAPQPEPLTARRQHFDLRTAVQNLADDARCRLDQMFAVVEDQQHLLGL